MSKHYLTTVLRSMPSLTDYTKALGIEIMRERLSQEQDIIKKIQANERLPVESIRSCVYIEYNRNEIAYFQRELLELLVKVHPDDYYAKKIQQDGADYQAFRRWFQQGIMDGLNQPLSVLQMKQIQQEKQLKG